MRSESDARPHRHREAESEIPSAVEKVGDERTLGPVLPESAGDGRRSAEKERRDEAGSLRRLPNRDDDENRRSSQQCRLVLSPDAHAGTSSCRSRQMGSSSATKRGSRFNPSGRGRSKGTTLRRDVFPQPLVPTIATNSPSSTSSETPVERENVAGFALEPVALRDAVDGELGHPVNARTRDGTLASDPSGSNVRRPSRRTSREPFDRWSCGRRPPESRRSSPKRRQSWRPYRSRIAVSRRLDQHA